MSKDGLLYSCFKRCDVIFLFWRRYLTAISVIRALTYSMMVLLSRASDDLPLMQHFAGSNDFGSISTWQLNSTLSRSSHTWTYTGAIPDFLTLPKNVEIFIFFAAIVTKTP